MRIGQLSSKFSQGVNHSDYELVLNFFWASMQSLQDFVPIKDKEKKKILKNKMLMIVPNK